MSRRIRKHANPFNVITQVGAVDREALFGRLADLEVDLGCGGASFIFARARANPGRDFIGLEVRKPLVEAAMIRRERDGPKNLHVFYANANANMNLALAAPGVIRCFHVHFPDPCFKRRHWKRRVLQPRTVRTMAELLPVGGHVYAQSDVQLLAGEMYAFLSADGSFESRLAPDMRAARPFPECTEWELHHEVSKEPIYRMLFEKVREPCGPVPEIPFGPSRGVSE